jgi:hypothetical protein
MKGANKLSVLDVMNQPVSVDLVRDKECRLVHQQWHTVYEQS